MASGLVSTGADGEVLRPPLTSIPYLRCAECGGLLRFLIRYRGRALCKSCIAIEATRGGRP